MLPPLAIQLGKNGSLAKARAALSEAVTVLEQLPDVRHDRHATDRLCNLPTS